jgi:hypothetical protein
MFNIDNLESYIDDALKSWHGSLEDPTNAAMKFFGENGELIDYIAKCMFKPNFNADAEHIISEIGDAWYYWRILSKIYSIDKEYILFNQEETDAMSSSHPNKLAIMAVASSAVYAGATVAQHQDNLFPLEDDDNVKMFLSAWLGVFIPWLEEFKVDFDEMHQFNVNKLGGPTNHGWNPNTQTN